MDTQLATPHCPVPRLTLDGCATWDVVAAAFADCEAVPFMQGWRAHPEDGFRPACARLGWSADGLLVLAELGDDDVFNPVTAFNEPAYERGDVFEMFLQPAGGTTYYEVHVNPNNAHFQLRIPSPEILRARRGDPQALRDWRLDAPEVISRVRVDADQKQWRVLALVPWAIFGRTGHPAAGERWRFSFSRYDYTRGAAGPVLSSTSPHTRIDYHRIEEWGVLEFT